MRLAVQFWWPQRASGHGDVRRRLRRAAASECIILSNYLDIKNLDVEKLRILDAGGPLPVPSQAMGDLVDRMVRQWGRERPDLPLAGLGVQARVKLLSKHYQREADSALEPFELEPWAWEILAALRRQAEPFEASPGRLCGYTGVTSGSITNRLDRLESCGLVQRQPHPDDRRGVLVRLTDAGFDLVERAANARFRIAEERMQPLDQGEREQLEDFLRRLLAAYPGSQEVPDMGT